MAGGELRSHKASQVRYVPGSSVTVEYRAKVRWSGGATTNEILVAAAGISSPEGTASFAADGIEVSFWRYPDDPFLPGLASATNPDRVAGLLEQLGVTPGKVRLRTRAYRPGRRAVVEVNTPRARIFLKIVRPERVASLQEIHVAVAGHVPVPHSFGWSRDLGIVAMQALQGRTLRKSLSSGSRRQPGPAALIALLDQFPDPGASPRVVAGPHERAAGHARMLATVAPDLAGRLGAIVERMQEVEPEDAVPVHGDFHSSQVLVSGSDVVGLVDVDTAGVGERANDLAGMLGHLATLSLTEPSRRNIERYGAELIREFDTQVDPVGLRLRVAGVVLGLATGPFRVQSQRWPAETEQRVALSERWIDSAESTD
jgi:hypothetical protein